MEALPEDCLAAIFTVLPLPSLRATVLVNRRWKRVASGEFYLRGQEAHRKGRYRHACVLFSKSIQLEPKFALVYEERALARLHLKDKAGALADFRACLVVIGNQSSPYGKIIDGIVRSEEGRDDLAIAKLSEVIDGCSLEEAGSVLLANAYFERGYSVMMVNLENAISDFTNSLHLKFPRAYAAFNNRAWCKEAKGDRKGAIADYQAALQSNPYYTMSVTNLCNMLTRLDDGSVLLQSWDRTLSDQIKQHVASGEDMQACSHLYLHRGQVRKSLSQWTLAIDDYTRALDFKHDLNYLIYYYRGQCYELQSDLPAALDDYTKSIAANSFYADPLSNRAHIHSSMGDNGLALQDMTAYKERSPADPYPYQYIAALHADLNDYANAIGELQVGASKFPKDYDTLELLGHFYGHESNMETALEFYNKAIALASPKTRALKYRAGVHFIQRKYQEALNDFDAYLEKGPHDLDALVNRGVTYFALGEVQTAVLDFTSAVGLNPLDSAALTNRALCYCSLGRFALAITDATLVQTGGDPLSHEWLALLRRIKRTPNQVGPLITVQNMRLHYDRQFQPYLKRPLEVPLDDPALPEPAP